MAEKKFEGTYLTFLIESEQNHCCDKTKKVLVVEKITKILINRSRNESRRHYVLC